MNDLRKIKIMNKKFVKDPILSTLQIKEFREVLPLFFDTLLGSFLRWYGCDNYCNNISVNVSLQ
jgi:hypothetical protein